VNACHSQWIIKTYLGADEGLDVSAATMNVPVAVSSLGGGGRVADVPPHHRHRITDSASTLVHHLASSLGLAVGSVFLAGMRG
jgi:hypothetical protein